ncbi:hypothetical protein GCM10022271_24140 [Corallibacter vietnamensis]|uniref:DUF4349 domain-containing protein n=2 Tax=Corallibacter TaxID=1511643 RepID=A0ABP7HCB5_9FLAO
MLVNYRNTIINVFTTTLFLKNVDYPVNNFEIAVVKENTLSYLCSKLIIQPIMFDFDQYLGFLAFLTILTIGFWVMIFLLTFVIPYWIGGALIERLKEIKEERKAKRAAH